MFTGIVEETGKVISITGKGTSLSLAIGCTFSGELSTGESVAVNGCCLTVIEKNQETFTADVTPETFRRTSLGSLTENSTVNLERAMKADGRFGGHIVSGHIDGRGRIISLENEGNAVNVKISVPASLGKYIIEKGSVTVDGISLTVAQLSSEKSRASAQTVFSIAVIPHTWKNTSLCTKNSGDTVNIECDIVGKYIEHFLTGGVSFNKAKSTGTSLLETAQISAPEGSSSPEASLTDSDLMDFMSGIQSFH